MSRATAIKISLSIILAAAILWWMYRETDINALRTALTSEMHWGWMILSMPFGILAQAIRGWRWRLSLEPLGENPRRESCVNAIFISYAVSLIVPRLGEFARCGTLAKSDHVSFVKSLGTVVTERAIDSLLMLTITAVVISCQLPLFSTFFAHTGLDIPASLRSFTPQGYLVATLCLIVAAIFLWLFLRRLTLYNKIRLTLAGLWSGIVSLRHLRQPQIYTLLTIAIWLSYFLHYYLTFFCFDATSHLGIMPALVTFVVGTIAVIVPTPNGAGPWHFAVKTMLVLYGVEENQALLFVLIVHTLQTLLVALLGIYAWIRQSLC